MSNVSNASAGFPIGPLSLIFWLVVHYAVPLGTTWGGVSVHVAAYWVLLLGFIGPLVIMGVLLLIVLIVGLLA